MPSSLRHAAAAPSLLGRTAGEARPARRAGVEKLGWSWQARRPLVAAGAGGAHLASLPADHEVHALVRQVGAIAARLSRDETALAMVQRIFKRMYEQAGGAGRPAVHAGQRAPDPGVQQVVEKVGRFVSDVLLYSDDERKLHAEIVSALLHAGLLSMAELSSHLAKHIDGGRNVAATAFAIRVVRLALLEEQIATAAECAELLQALSKLTHAPQRPPTG